MTYEEEKRYMEDLSNEDLIACLYLYTIPNPRFLQKDYNYTLDEIQRRLSEIKNRKEKQKNIYERME